MKNFKLVGVVGAGQMGNGIAQVVASKNISITLFDIQEIALDNAKKTISSSCDRMVKKNIMTLQQKIELMDHIKYTTKMSDLASCEFVIEAATENVNLKLDIFKKLDETVSKNSVLCSNTSSISITKIASVTKRPEKVAGMHFMNPVPIMKLVEGIRGLQTSDETFLTVRNFAESLDKTFVEAKDYPGFIVNRILMPMINEAIYALYENVGTPEDIDSAMKLGTNQPMGPLQLADFIGLDTCLAIMNVLYEGLGDSKYRPCPLLVKYVEASWLGRKTMRGFYKY